MGLDRQAVVRGVQGLGQRDEVEERRGDDRRERDVPPAGTVIQRRGQHRERGHAVEEHRDSEPEQRHRRKGQYIRLAVSGWL